MFLLFNWEGSSGVQAVLGMINNILKIIRWVVPIGLIIMTSLDVAKKVINPEDKEKKIKEVPEEEKDNVMDAAESCPVGAIEVEE